MFVKFEHFENLCRAFDDTGPVFVSFAGDMALIRQEYSGLMMECDKRN